MEIVLECSGFSFSEEIPDEAVKGVYAGHCCSLWYDTGSGEAGVVNVTKDTYERLRVAGVPEIRAPEGVHPNAFALREIGVDLASLGVDPGALLERVYVRRSGFLYTDETHAWLQTDGAVCYVEEVHLDRPGLPERWLEVRLPWNTDVAALERALATAGHEVSRLEGYDCVVARQGSSLFLTGKFPTGGSYLLLPLPKDEEDALVWASGAGAEAFGKAFGLVRSALGQRIDHRRLADSTEGFRWRLAGDLWDQHRPVAVELFAGAGGMLSGLRMAGWDVRVAVEIDPQACATLRANFPDLVVIQKDIHEVTADEIRAHAGSEIDLVSGGPPCQGYSTAGKRLIDDPRNTLYREFVRLVGELRPKVVMMENVPGLLSMKHVTGNWAIQDIMEDLEAAGYRPDVKLLDASLYGVPQFRKRLFFHAVRKDIPGRLPWPGPVTLPPGELLRAEEAGLRVGPGESLEAEPRTGDLVFVTPGAGEGYFARCCGVEGEGYRARYTVADLRGRVHEVNYWNVLVYPGRGDAEEAARLLKRTRAAKRSSAAPAAPGQLSLFVPGDQPEEDCGALFDRLLGCAAPWELERREADEWNRVHAVFARPEAHPAGVRPVAYVTVYEKFGGEEDSAKEPFRARRRSSLAVTTGLRGPDEAVTLNTYVFEGEDAGDAIRPGLLDRLFGRDVVLNLVFPEHHRWEHVLVGLLAVRYAARLREMGLETLADLIVYRTLGLWVSPSGTVERTVPHAPWARRDGKGRRTFHSCDPLRLVDPDLLLTAKFLAGRFDAQGIARHAAQVAFAVLAQEAPAEPWPGVPFPARLLPFRPYRTVWDAIGDLPALEAGQEWDAEKGEARPVRGRKASRDSSSGKASSEEAAS